MKKILMIAGVGVAVLLGTSCSDKKSDEAKANDLALSEAQLDSLSTLYGQAMGAQAIQMLINADSNVDKEAVVKAMQSAFSNDANESTLAGLYFAHTLLGAIYSQQQEGVQYDKAKVLNEFKKVFLRDSVTAIEAQDLAGKYEAINSKVQELVSAKQQAEKAQSPEAVQNRKSGEAFVNKVKKADSEVKTTESGLSYKIENKGEGAISENDMVSIIYKGTFTDGKVFDESHGEAVQLSPNGVIPGMKEALMMLGKGGKGTFYIPGNLAYGVDGVPQAGIGPDQMLVFELEVADVQPVEQKMP